MKRKFSVTIVAMLALCCLILGLTACKPNGGGSSSVAVTEVNLSETDILLEAGEEKTLTAEVLPENATNKNVRWSVAPDGVVRVEGGKVIAVAEGEAVITAQAGKITATCTVSVTPAEPEGTAGLMYELSEDGKTAILARNTSASGEITVAAKYQGKPVTEISQNAFLNNKKITGAYIPSSVKIIRDSAFSGCSALKSVTIGKRVETIEGWAFAWSGLESVVVPDSVKEIGGNLFKKCKSLAEVTLSANITEIKASTFYECTSLTRLVVPDKVTAVGSAAFQLCGNLEELVLPVGLKSIRAMDAVWGCTKLVIKYKGTVAQWAAVDCASDFKISSTVKIETIKCSDGDATPYTPKQN